MKSNDNTFSVEHANESCGFLLWKVTTLWQQEIKKALTHFDMAHTQYVIMASIHWLNLHNDEVTQVKLSHYTKIEPMTVSVILKTLQKKNWIIRKEHSTDTRAKSVELTEKGKKLIKKATVVVETTDRSFFEVLEKKDVNQLNQYLIRLTED